MRPEVPPSCGRCIIYGVLGHFCSKASLFTGFWPAPVAFDAFFPHIVRLGFLFSLGTPSFLLLPSFLPSSRLLLLMHGTSHHIATHISQQLTAHHITSQHHRITRHLITSQHHNIHVTTIHYIFTSHYISYNTAHITSHITSHYSTSAAHALQ